MSGVEPELRWWGPVEGSLHLFRGMLVFGCPIRTTRKAVCGWRPPVGLMESPAEPILERMCSACRGEVN